MKAFQDFVFAIDKRLPIKYEDAAAVADLTRDAIAALREFNHTKPCPLWKYLKPDEHPEELCTCHRRILARAEEQGVE